MKLEIACFDVPSALTAGSCGVYRIEFCANFLEGGITPSFEDVRFLKETIADVPIYVMIRPRGGDFIYTDAEFLTMKNQIQKFKDLKVDGFVFGILEAHHEIDLARNAELIAITGSKPCTFHRAFDLVSDASQSLNQLIDLGFQTVLTSGLAKNVMEGAPVLASLVAQADGKIEILCGGGLRSSNINELITITRAQAFHSSAITDDSLQADAQEIQNLLRCLKP